MRIKKYKNNHYLFSEGGIWIRNPFTNSTPVDINNLISTDDQKLMLENEVYNGHSKNPFLDISSFYKKYKNMIIVSDGYDYANKQKQLLGICHKTTMIVGVNGALRNWRMVGNHLPTSEKRIMHFYLNNNPYAESLNNLPKNHSYYPTCITSIRTNRDFIKSYSGLKYMYVPVPDENYSGKHKSTDMLDDYRNPICAALSFGIKCGIKKALLFCCDDSFKNERSGATKLENGLWSYPHQIKAQNILDDYLYWLKTNNIDVKNHSSGINLSNSEYINSEGIKEFIKE